MNALNLVVAIFGGAGVYLIFAGITGAFGSKASRLGYKEAQAKTARPTIQQRIEALLYQARAPISYTEFLATSISIGILIAAAFFFLTKGLLVSAAALFAGMGIYYLYLEDRRDRMAIEYEKVQPEIADIIAASFRSKGYNLPAVLNQVIESGPEVAREDWGRLAAALESHHPDDGVIAEVLAYRNSAGLWRIVEALRLFRHDLERLAPLMDKIRRDLNQEVAIEREIITEMVGPRKQLMYVAVMPAALLVIFILFSPEIGSFYASLIGQVVMILVLGASVVIYALGVRAAEKKMRISQPSAMISAGQVLAEIVPPADAAVLEFAPESPSGQGFLDRDAPREWGLSGEGLSEDDFLAAEGGFDR